MRTFKGMVLGGAAVLLMAAPVQAGPDWSGAGWSSGPYVGINFGGGWEHKHANGFQGGGDVGYRGNLGGIVVTGDILVDGAAIDGRYSRVSFVDDNTIAVGVPLGTWLPSVVAGFDVARTELDSTKESSTRGGFSYGVRLEHVFRQNGHDYVFRTDLAQVQYDGEQGGKVNGPILSVSLLMPF